MALTTPNGTKAIGLIAAILVVLGGLYSLNVDGKIYTSSNDTIEDIEKRYLGAVVKRSKWVSLETIKRVTKESLDYLWWNPDSFMRHVK